MPNHRALHHNYRLHQVVVASRMVKLREHWIDTVIEAQSRLSSRIQCLRFSFLTPTPAWCSKKNVQIFCSSIVHGQKTKYLSLLGSTTYATLQNKMQCCCKLYIWNLFSYRHSSHKAQAIAQNHNLHYTVQMKSKKQVTNFFVNVRLFIVHQAASAKERSARTHWATDWFSFVLCTHG